MTKLVIAYPKMLTCAAESITLVSSVAGAGVTPLSVVAHCIGMAIVSPQ